MNTYETFGIELIRRGWQQGSLFKAASAQWSWLAIESELRASQEIVGVLNAPLVLNEWQVRCQSFGIDDNLIVISQTCDIVKPPIKEPYVEVARSYWTSDRSLMHHAAKNSARLFLMQRRSNKNGYDEALVADIAIRALIQKESLLSAIPISAFAKDDTYTSRKFSRWLGRRYHRPALPDAIVDAIQKPIVRAVDNLPEADLLHRILDGIDEILFFLKEDKEPFQVEMIFMRDERKDVPQVSVEEAAKLAGWIADILHRHKAAELVYWEMLSAREISVHDYSNAYELPLDYYSPLDDGND